MAHQCKVKYIDRTPDEYGTIEETIKEEIFEFANHVTITPENGIIVKYFDDDWKEHVRYFNHKDVLAVHSR